MSLRSKTVYAMHLMMFPVEIFSIITTILLISVVQGLPDTCSLFCEQLTNQSKILRPECICTTFNPHGISNNASLSPSSKSIENISTPLKLNSMPDLQTRDTSSIPSKPATNIDSLQKIINNNFDSIANKSTVDFPIYFDIDLYKPPSRQNMKNSDITKELNHLFEKLRASDQNISQCIDLQMYVFSKRNDNINKTHSNWGHDHNVKHDNLTNSEVLTEFQNKCDHPTTIVRESIYEVIIQTTQGEPVLEKDRIYDDKKGEPDSKDFNKEMQRTDTDYKKNNLLETSANISGVNNHTMYPSTPNNLRRTLSSNAAGIRRNTIQEKDLLLTKIVTIEHINNRITSVVDGFEALPNLDFVSNGMYFPTVEASHTDLSDTQKVNSDQSSSIQDLNVSSGNNSISTRIIQNSAGEKHLAVDGFSLCDHMTQNGEFKIIFMKLICDCIQLHNCLR